MTTERDERAVLIGQRNRLDREAQALHRQLDNEELAATYEEMAARKDQEQRLDFANRTRHDLQARIDAVDLTMRRAAAEKEQIRAFATGQLQAARARLARVRYEEDNLQPVVTSLARRLERVVGEIALFEAQLRSIEPPPPAPREALAEPIAATSTTPTPVAPSLRRRVRDALAWSVDSIDDVDSGE